MQPLQRAPADALDWADWRPAPLSMPVRAGRWRYGVLTVIAIVHALGLLWPYGPKTQHSTMLESDTALQVDFLSRPAVLPEAPEPIVLPDRLDESAPVRRKVRNSAPDAAAARTVQDDAEATTQLLLGLPDDAKAAASFGKPRNPLDRHAALPSQQVETYLPDVRLHPGPSAKQVVEAIGALLFGARKTDYCEKARLQLANMQANDDPQDTQDALGLRERYCRP